MELVDIVNENDELTGETCERSYCHENNLFHRHVSCWIINNKGEILLQKRALTKRKNPGMWSKTGGHVIAGETVVEGLKREVKEELGIDLLDSQMTFMKKFKSENPNYFSYNYIVTLNMNLDELVLQEEEVSEVKFFTIEYLEEQKRLNNKSFTFSSWEDDDFYKQMDELKEIRNK